MAYGTKKDSDPIILGSGELYLGIVPNIETATETEIVPLLENVGAIEGGASLTYKPSFKEVESSNRGTIAKFLSKEEVTFKTGIITWDLDNLKMLCPANVKEDVSNNTKTMIIGGQGAIPVNYLRFEHTKKDGKKLTINIYKASADGGFEFNFDSEKPLSVNYEFTALAKNDGSLVEIVEEM